MKLAFFIAIFSTLALADDVIVLNDNGTVTRNGTSINNASDALLNKAMTSAEFMEALAAKIAVANAAATQARADLATLQTQMTTQLNADLSAFQVSLKTATDPTVQAILNAQITLVQGYIAAASQSPAQIRAAQLSASIAAQQAELAKLQSATPQQ